MKAFKIFIVLLLVFGFLSSAHALTLSGINGQWTGVAGTRIVKYTQSTTAYGNGSESQVRWGWGFWGRSGLGFTGASYPSTGIEAGKAFEIGQLRHFNNRIFCNSGASKASLQIGMTFSNSNGHNQTVNFNFDFDIDETPNWFGGSKSDDIISFPNALSSETFQIDGTVYALELLGFGDYVDDMIDKFISPEGSTNSTKIWARVRVVPEPATVFLFGTGLLGLAGFSRKKFLGK